MKALVNDRWRGEFPVTRLGRYLFTIEGWVDHFETWSRQLQKRLEAGQDVTVELEVGARLIEQAAARADGDATDAARLLELSQSLRAVPPAALDGEARLLMRRYADRSYATVHEREDAVLVEPVLEAPAGERRPLGEAEQARAGAGDLRFSGGEHGRWVAHLDRETVPGSAFDAQLDRG